ncbi:hypothetical protein SPRG_01208 [Saprolegnia parasitica CBS 223.65]|uniref:Uncharacterized protein n=1 Tax=Saprolegnia parasitica (strain CBS 223.65) TaxID=695850 RepID=A0A067D938_SAPPC|nr:hypothetical protein SPRG_01208 [Saprolegnia parasitica CBS 223.65]KDO35141.1 hypothetical protein SPRG_01208 [Saprolegnia parasitica CBS 223.65]|eukprot:XP_012194790.1 hypothetical protein SPRG_01208 [Saprolegnia parasitica CBS 223.65]
MDEPSLVPVKASCWARLYDMAGVFYLVSSMGLSVVALLLSSEHLANDLFWPAMPSSSSSLAAVFTSKLLLEATEPVLDVTQTVLASSAIGSFSPAYPRLMLFGQLTSMADAVDGLRRLLPSNVLTMVSPYCWVDLERRYEMAYTLQRQARCLRLQSDNAAVYMETVLRNTDVDAFAALTQGRFAAYFTQPIADTGPEGAAYVAALYAHTRVPAADEVAFWAAHGCRRFVLQYGNRDHTGLLETILLRNVFRFEYAYPIKAIEKVSPSLYWTTSNLYGLLYDDLYALAPNMSFIRSTPSFWADENPRLIETYNNGSPLSALAAALHAQVGLLGAIDAVWVPPPATLVAAVRQLQAAVTAGARGSPALQHFLLAADNSMLLTPTPLQWQDPSLRFAGGNLLCLTGMRQTYVQEVIGYDDACSTQMPLAVPWDPLRSLFAAAFTNTTSSSALCAQCPGTQATDCSAAFLRAHAAAQMLSLGNMTVAALPPIALTQYVFANSSDAPQIQLQQILDPSWAFFGAMMLYDWATNVREVLSLQGDVQTIVAISKAYTPAPPTRTPPSAMLGTYLRVLSSTVSLWLVLVGVVALLMLRRRRRHARDWFFFNRITSSVWVTRVAVLVRGATAVAILATSELTAAPTPALSSLAILPRSPLTSCLLANEANWLLYALHELIAPLCRPGTLKRVAPFSTSLCGLCIALLDVLSPVQVSATLRRSCHTMNMDQMVYCSSGSVEVGSWYRALGIAAIVLAAGLATLVAAALQPPQPPRKHFDASPYLSWAALAFLDDATALDDAVLAMCGIFRTSERRLFDSKLWLFVQRPTPNSPTSMLLHDARPPVSVDKRSWRLYHRSLAVGGIAYLACTLSGNVAYLGVLATGLSNDFGWSGFNTSGMHVYLAKRINFELLLASDTTLSLDSPSLGDVGADYSGTHTNVLWSPTLARRELFRPDAALDGIVAGLRAMDPCQLPWMFTQYCFVDLDRQWSMAATAARHVRCKTRYLSNAAVYLEAPLRNLGDWDAWHGCWGESFRIGIASHLQGSEAGRRWLETVASNSVSISDEVAYWRVHGIDRFVLQWQNYKLTGFQDAMVLGTALGTTHALPLAQFTGSFRFHMQTSMHLYWALASDLWAVANNASGVGGGSLVRASATFVYANTTPDAVLRRNGSVASPLPAGLAPVITALGPFGVIDTNYVPCPASLITYLGAFTHALATLLFTEPDAALVYSQLQTKAFLGPMPHRLLHLTDVSIVGGDLLCGGVVAGAQPSLGLFMSFGVNNLCNWWYSEAMSPTAAQLLFALLALDANTTDADGFCSQDVFVEATCASLYAAHIQFLNAYNTTPFQSLAATTAKVHADVVAIGVRLIQFVQSFNGSLEQTLYEAYLLDDEDRNWSFYGWCFLYEWAIGLREVVSFEGDSGTLPILSSAIYPVTLTLDPSLVPTEIAYLFQTCAKYVTYVFIALSGVLGVYSLACRGLIEGWNLFDINRLVGHVWVGRPLLMLRSVTAMWLLNTTSLTLLRTQHAGTRLWSPPLPWYTTLLAASELTWLVYIVNDLLSCYLHQHTPHYATHSSLMTYVGAVVFTSAWPQGSVATLRRTCVYIDMDAALSCSSAFIEIGNVVRIAVDGAIVLGCITLAGKYECWAHRHRHKAVLPTALLSSVGYYMLYLEHWRVDGGVYIDQASAAMAGLLTCYWQESLYVFDIKLWRLHRKPSYRGELDLLGQRRFHYAIPLDDFAVRGP